MEIPMPANMEQFQSSLWSWVTYEINPQGATDTVDVLLVSNAQDGMYMIIPPDKPTTWGDLLNQTWATVKQPTGATEPQTWADVISPKGVISAVDTQGKKFGVTHSSSMPP